MKYSTTNQKTRQILQKMTRKTSDILFPRYRVESSIATLTTAQKRDMREKFLKYANKVQV